jgi:hypothetical protein
LLDSGESYVEANLDMPGAVFWIELNHGEGELRVGLGCIADVPHALEDDIRRWVSWFERKGKSRRAWGNVVAFQPAIIYEEGRGRRKAVQTTEEEVAFFLPVAVETVAGADEDEPKISMRCMQVLRQYVATKRADSLADSEQSSESESEERV